MWTPCMLHMSWLYTQLVIGGLGGRLEVEAISSTRAQIGSRVVRSPSSLRGPSRLPKPTVPCISPSAQMINMR